MKIRNIVHKGLKRLYMEDSSKGLAAETIDKLNKLLAFLQDMQSANELRTISVLNLEDYH